MKPHILRCGRHAFDWTRPLIMGVVNVTLDSFSDGGRFLRRRRACARACAANDAKTAPT